MKHKGFTVLEFLIVIGMIMIIIALALVGLSNARSSSRDQAKIANLQSIAVGVQQYHDICREYPANLESTQSCNALTSNGDSLGSLIPDIDNYQFNTGGDYNYNPIAPNETDVDYCSHFHMWVQLENENKTINASRFNSSGTGSGVSSCQAFNPMPVDATNNYTIYDIYR